MGGAALASWTNAGEPNRMARVKAAIRVFIISLHAESHLHGRRVNRTNGASRVKCAKSPLISAKRGHKGRRAKQTRAECTNVEATSLIRWSDPPLATPALLRIADRKLISPAHRCRRTAGHWQTA